jgi:hypothetical protein
MLAALRWWADLLDSRFRVPGTDIRFGIDPILSLVPVIGELATPVFAGALFAYAVAAGVPRIVIVRMAINALIDVIVGAIPIAGNVIDVFWRANTTNLALLERHAVPGVKPTRGDYAFVWGLAALFAAVLAIPLVAAGWLLFIIIF